MDDKEIYNLAAKIVAGIVDDFQRINYDEIHGNFSVYWGTEKEFNASAHSPGEINKPPEHSVTLNYELARQIYRDAEEFYEFLSAEIKRFDHFFQIYQPPTSPGVPPSFDKEKFIHFFFVGALTFILAHEVGHLTQEHGYIRKKFGETSRESVAITEYSQQRTKEPLTPRESLISQVTELAADFEAINWCIWELARQTIDDEKTDASVELFIDGIFVFCCAMTCTFYRFNGLKAINVQAIPDGSHPRPIYRAEKNITQLIELIDLSREGLNVKTTRAELVYRNHRAAGAATVFWLSQHAQPEEVVREFLVGGTSDHPDMNIYLSEVLRAWDEIEPEINRIKRFRMGLSREWADKLPDFGLMVFSTSFREKYGAISK